MYIIGLPVTTFGKNELYTQMQNIGALSPSVPWKKTDFCPNSGFGRKVKFYQFFAIFLNQSFEQMNQYDLEDLHRRSYMPTTYRKMWGKD